MEIIKTDIEGLVVIRPNVFEDKRGYFFESFNKRVLLDAGIKIDFVQDNQSLSNKGVLRGLHFQNPPHAQGKLVRVIKGAVLDVAVDIRKNSPTYGKWHAQELTEQNKMMFWIPEGFAHGFLTLEDETIFFYKCTNFYSKSAEGVISWNDSDLNIDWGINDPVLSSRDEVAPPFNLFESLF